MVNDAFEQALQNAINIARLAPSSHNCQPWSVHYDAVTRCGGVAIDRQRALKGLPSLEREMLMSCGIFFEYLSTLLKYSGYPLDWQWVGAQQNGSTDMLISFAPGAPCVADLAAYQQWVQRISDRHTVRTAYQPTQVNEQQQAQLYALFDRSPVTCNIKYGEATRHDVAFLTANYASLDFADQQAWRETYHYIRFNEQQAAEDGFYLHHLFGPVSCGFRWFFRIAFHPRLSWLAKRLRLPASMAKGLAELVVEGPQYLALSLEHESDENLFIAGMKLGQLWLMLQSWGWSLHPISVLVQHATARRALADTARLTGLPVFFARFGQHRQSGIPTPRRAWQRILTTTQHSFSPENGADVKQP
ncbi:prodigiosin biosynthesis protein PigM [Brenneria uluponensis]|uniref:prodigiosin biosynthesis protein PigM n=1 Tax=Brenneria uluponensis TaxID=3057057 RepID=UPI0028E898CC|nr:prodigiosin biosynthesis protein PigM [Brenneria ulupoensis]